MSRKDILPKIGAAIPGSFKSFVNDEKAQVGGGLGLNSIMGSVQNALGGDGGASASSREGVPPESVKEGADYKGLKWGDFQNTYGDNLQAGVWRDLAEYVVGAQNAFNIGWGMADYPDVVGRWYMVLNDSSGNLVVGEARIKTRNSNDENVDSEVRAVPTSRLDTNPSDYRVQYPVPENRKTPKVGQDSKIVIQFRLSSASTGTSVDFTHANTVLDFPTTNYS